MLFGLFGSCLFVCCSLLDVVYCFCCCLSQGTQRSILRAQELIEEALLSPDIDGSNPSPPQTRGASPDDPKLDAPLSAPPLSSCQNRAVSPSSSQLRKRHSDISLPTMSTSQLKATPISSSVTTFSSPTYCRIMVTPTTVSESSRYIPTDASTTTSRASSYAASNIPGAKCIKPQAWKLPREREGCSVANTMTTVSTITIATVPPLYSYAKSLSHGCELTTPSTPPSSSQSLSSSLPAKLMVLSSHEEVHEQLSSDVTKVPHPLTPPQTPNPSVSTHTVRDEADSVRRHSRSMSDSQVLGTEQDTPLERPHRETQSLSLPIHPSQGHQHFSPTMPTIASPTTEGTGNDLSLGRHLGSQKLPIGAEKAAALAAAAITKKSTNALEVSSAQPEVQRSTSATAVSGSGVVKTTRNVAVIQPTQVWK